LYQREFNKILESGNIPKALMLFGEVHFLIDRYFKLIKERINPDEVTIFYNFDYSFESARGSISQGSLFANTQMLVIKSEDKLPTKELKELIKTAQQSENSWFIYLFYGDNFKDNQKAFGDKFVRFFNPKPYEIKDIIFSEVGKRDFQISEDGVEKLIYLKNSNLALIVSEIEKLANYGKKSLEAQDIIKLVSPSGDVELDRVIGYFFRSGDFGKLVKYVSLHGVDEVMVVAYMSKFVEELYIFRSAIEMGESLSSLSLLGRKLPPQVEREKIAMGRRFNLIQIEKFLFTIMRSEVEFKSGEVGDKTSLLVERLIEIAKIIR